MRLAEIKTNHVTGFHAKISLKPQDVLAEHLMWVKKGTLRFPFSRVNICPQRATMKQQGWKFETRQMSHCLSDLAPIIMHVDGK